MNKIKKSLEDKLNKNSIILRNLKNDYQDMKNYINKNNTIIYINCINLKINIESTMNRIEFINCKNCKIKVKKLISGIYINKSSNIYVYSRCLSSVYVDKSSNINVKSIYDSHNDIFMSTNINLKKLIK